MSHNKAKLLKQLQQLDIDIDPLRSSTLTEIQEKCDELLRSSYSYKYIGVKENQIGILSKRVKPFQKTSDILPKA